MKKKKPTNLKRYLTGTSVKNYIQDPSTQLYENDVNVTKAKLKAESNPFTQILQGLGTTAMGYGLNQAGLGQFSGLLNQVATMANGGTVNNVPVEVEGDEVMETPDGTVAEFKGPSHENGGIPIDLPEGTEIFSKRIQKMGESMAERKIKREKKVSKLEKLLEKNPKDTITKKTLNRVLDNNKLEEEADMQLQEDMTRMMEESIMMACGGKVRKNMADGGIVDEFGNKQIGNEIQLPNNQQTIINYQLDQVDPTYLPLSSSGNTNTPEEKSKFANLLSNVNTSNSPTAGDVVGLAGTAVSTFSPYFNTLKNRASDTPNVNYFENYGEKGLQTLDKSKQYVSQEKDKALQDLELARQSQLSRSRNSARGINTLRAFDLAATQAANKASGDIYSSFANQMMGILGQEAGMQNQQDQVVMGGERAKDIADRMDKDNFYTQLASSMSNIGTGLQAGGKSLNQIKGRGDNAAMIDEIIEKAGGIENFKLLMQEFLKSQGKIQ